MMYYKLQRVDGRGGAAAFNDEARAKELCDTFNERYDSDYEVVEVAFEDVSAQELVDATIISLAES